MQLALGVGAAPVIEISVAGAPQPQGSKVARIVGRRIKVAGGGNAVVDPKIVMTEQADMKTETMPAHRLADWRDKVRRAAFVAWRKAHGDKSPDPWDAACELSIEFVIVRPDGDWKGPGVLKRSARQSPEVRPDLSKLVRAVEDSLSGVVYRDDSRVVRYGPTWKRYAAWQGAGGAIVTVRLL